MLFGAVRMGQLLIYHVMKAYPKVRLFAYTLVMGQLLIFTLGLFGKRLLAFPLASPFRRRRLVRRLLGLDDDQGTRAA